MIETLRVYKSADINVIITGTVPNLGYHQRACLARPKYLNKFYNRSCSVFTSNQILKRLRPVDELIVGAVKEADHGIYIPVSQKLCAGRTSCSSLLNNQLLYKDADHISHNGAKYMFPLFAEELNKHVQAGLPPDIVTTDLVTPDIVTNAAINSQIDCEGLPWEILKFSNAKWNKGKGVGRASLMFKNLDKAFFNDIETIYIPTENSSRRVRRKKFLNDSLQTISLEGGAFLDANFDQVCLNNF